MRNKNIIFRHATLKDAFALAEAGARMFRDTFERDNTPKDMQRYLVENFSLAKIESELQEPASTFLLLLENDDLRGYAKISMNEAPPFVVAERPIEICRIYVDRKVISKGYGAALMRGCLEEARKKNCDTVWLGVWEKNDRAINFYQRWGFQIVGEHEFILGSDTQNDYIMTRTVANEQA